MVFADVRFSTALGERSTATEFAGRLNQFYSTATEVLIAHDAIIDKLIGDEVMALFLPGLAGPDYRRRAVLAALPGARFETIIVRGRDEPVHVAVLSVSTD